MVVLNNQASFTGAVVIVVQVLITAQKPAGQCSNVVVCLHCFSAVAIQCLSPTGGFIATEPYNTS